VSFVDETAEVAAGRAEPSGEALEVGLPTGLLLDAVAIVAEGCDV
jgi:hypothetical protein